MASRPRPLIMGIVNVTPDSFSDGGRLANTQAAVDHGLAMLAQGADILDIGGESTRPGATDVPVEAELARTIPVIEALRAATTAPISIDTRKPDVARAAMAAGADCWNDVSALTFAEDSLATAVELAIPVILMHAQGTPATMQAAPAYRDVTAEVRDFLVGRIGQAVAAGLPRERLILDPGIGFGKTLDHNLALLSGLQRLAALGCPLLVGTSRKSMIAGIDVQATDTDDRLGGSLASMLAAVERGAAIVRVHDVRETAQALAVWAAIRDFDA
ncbi:MAG: dihydropteroate synthase [Hyphomonadaceae bacterium]|nr:dihydropteroate synthase [Hyphomonadaceae bacterium]